MKRIKDLNGNCTLVGLKLRTKKGVVGYFHSLSVTVVNLQSKKGDDFDEGRLYPQIINGDISDWTIMDCDVPVNCHIRTTVKDIDNT